MAQFERFVGLDIGKYSIAVCADGVDTPFEVSNDDVGFEHLLAALKQLGLKKADALLVLEPTGGYEIAVWAMLIEQGYQARRVDAKQVRHFAKARGLLAKTDPIDACLLRDYACTFPERGQDLTCENQRTIKALTCRRSALVEVRKGIRCRLKQTVEAELITMDRELEAVLTSQIKAVEQELSRRIAKDGEMENKFEKLRPIPGIGPVMGWMLLAHMPELGKAGDKQIAALAGVAPFAHDSGRSSGKRFVQLGRRALRNVLYQAALVATQHNPDLKIFADRLKKAGKPHKLVITAVARKLIILANTIVRQNRNWKSQV